jgi:DNA invertase Pin-like site-specific DNA recombinase
MVKVEHSKPINNRCIALVRNSLGFVDVNLQLQEIEMYAKRNSLNVVDQILIDDLSTSELLKLIEGWRKYTFICWRLDVLPLDIKKLEQLLVFLLKVDDLDSALISIKDELNSNRNSTSYISGLSSAWLQLKLNRKVTNARASSLKAKERNHKLGRKKIRNDEEIYSLRCNGHTIREIAEKIQLSTTAVQRSLKNSLSDTKLKEKVTDFGLVCDQNAFFNVKSI